MPRWARAIVPGFPHHIVQRGRNRENPDGFIFIFIFILSARRGC